MFERDFFADSGEHLPCDPDERGQLFQRHVVDDAGAATEQRKVTLVRVGDEQEAAADLELAEEMLSNETAQFHCLHVLPEELQQLLAADAHHAADLHRLNRRPRRSALQHVGVSPHELALEREPGVMLASVVVMFHILELSTLDEGPPPCRLAFGFEPFAPPVVHGLAVLPDELIQPSEVDAVLR